MNSKSIFIAIVLIFVFLSCSKDKDTEETLPPPTPPPPGEITIKPNKISFVHEDGTPIATDECINPTSNYAVLISTKYEGNLASTDIKSTPINYTLNGTSYVATFTKDGDQILNIAKLNNGINSAEIVGTELRTQINLTAPETFKLVE